MAKIFISYRREDSQYQADRLHAAIAPHVQDAARDIFIDIDNIPLGVNFATYLDEKVSQCEVLLALIGPGWLTATDGEGKRRLDNPDDFVRIEIASALKRGIPVVPVLLDGAPVPAANDLPADLKELARRNGTAIQRQTFETDAVRLVKGLGLIRAEPEPAAPAAPPKPPKGKSSVSLMLGIAAAVLIAVIGGFALSQSQFWDAGESDWAGEPASNGVGEPTDTRLGSGELYEIVESGDPLPPGIVSGEVPDATPERVYRPGQTFRDRLSGGGQGPEMVVVPAGSFRMGSPLGEPGREEDEGPQRTVRIDYQFAVGKYEVTWAEWEACVADGGCNGAGPEGAGGDNGWGKGSRPVINVNWNDAQAYVQWLSRKTGEDYRLLSEAEWEYVARAGTTGRFSWGDGDPVCRRGGSNGANFISCTSNRTEPVGFSAANAFGLDDLHGNVLEWTEDCWNDSYAGAPSDGSVWASGTCLRRVVRGGSWIDIPRFLRSAVRIGSGPTLRYDGIGFRVARTL